MQDLLSHGHEFSYSQVMRIARMHLGAGDLEIGTLGLETATSSITR
jgi:hypothetical protein